MQKKCNICNNQYQCVLQRCNRSVTNCNKCNRRLEAGCNCLYLKFKGFFSLSFFLLKRAVNSIIIECMQVVCKSFFKSAYIF